jgi:GNAT superfamily N-acetyltransferase
MSLKSSQAACELVIRQANANDAEPCGRIFHEAFRGIAEKHNFPPEMPSREIAIGVMTMFFGSPGFYCVVAESGGRIVGSNCLDERSTISGIGPLTVDPEVQDGGIGRRLMQAVIDRSDRRGLAGVRLVQTAYHMRSLSLYTKLGFAAREELVVVNGTPVDSGAARCRVRPMSQTDIPLCNRLCMDIHGFHRGGELAQAIAANFAFVAERDGEIRAYTSGLGYFGHSVAETMDALTALMVQAPHLHTLGLLIPVRNHQLFRWCLDHGMRAVQAMTLMTRGLYQEPAGTYLPSILY